MWIIEVIPTKVEMFKSIASSYGVKMYLEILNITKKTVFRVNILSKGYEAPAYLE
jgi:hypothetical protein